MSEPGRPETKPAPGEAILPASIPSSRRHPTDAVAALSLANLCFLNSWFSLLYDADLGFFNRLRVTDTVLAALLCNLLLFATVFWLGAKLVRRHRPRILAVAACLATLAFLSVPVEFFRITLLNVPDRKMLHILIHPLTLGVVLAGFAWIVWRPRQVMRVLAGVLLIFAPLVLVSLGKILLLLLHVVTLAQHAEAVTPPPPLAAQPPPARVVWIIFDEMDQRVSFPERPASLKLPEFDRLRAESLSASNALPPSYRTLFSMPALLTGMEVGDAKPASAADLNLRLSEIHQTVRMTALTNVFSRARALGCNTALVGWYLPYSRLLGPGLNFCAWFPSPASEPARAATFGGSFWKQIRNQALAFHLRKMFTELYRNQLDASLNVVTNTAFGLVHLHLVTPHKPPIYDAERDRLTPFGRPFPAGYFDNLRLADRTLGRLRAAMEANGTWDRTWVLISADHWWRDSGRYDGKVDHRVPFILKAPGHSTSRAYDMEFNTLLSSDLVLAILRGEVRDLNGAAAWLDAHRRPVAANYDATTIAE